MTDFNRSSTLSLRRAGDPASSASWPKPAAPAQPHGRVEPAAATPAVVTGRALDSIALLQGRSHVSIMHNGEAYQLRATRHGKLILTK